MTTTTSATFEVHVPYEQKALNPEVKRRGGRWNPNSKRWSLPDTTDNRAFAATIKPLPSQLDIDDRVAAIAANAVAQLNCLGAGEFILQFASNIAGVSIAKQD